ncbi:unnamed protein product [Prunus armeniaca]|uniref:Wall-associated receptor kinase galacturonan-binding domain-containing protein n=1 Tax=Prunus armeniaca TaxID=36596 RepID=A0A6J5WZL9_PRUAR|nr:unnamed protein product [Prunus armeniaca]
MEGVCFQSLHGNPIMQLISLLAIVLELVFVLAISTSSTAAVGDDHRALLHQALPGCSDHCGNITIPYPFSMARDVGQPEPSIGPIPYLMMDNHTSLRVTNISLDGKLHVLQPIARKCIGDEYQTNSSLYLPDSFTISDTKNKFFAIGCGTAASFEGRRCSPKLGHGGPGKERHLHASGYSFALCNDDTTENNDDSCSGDGCGQAYIPSGLFQFEMVLELWYSNNLYSCSYGFFVEQGEFTFSPNISLQQLNKTSHLPLVLNWEIGDHGPCSSANNSMDFACKGNST